MRLHHLNCISTCPLGGRLMDGFTPSVFARGQLACHCVLVEGRRGLVLIDTGLGLQDVRHPRRRLSGFFLMLVSPDFREEMTAVRQIERLGFHADDVSDIVLTHLDFDHAGGLDDFPRARVHLLARERTEAEAQRTWLDRQRFRPQQWSSRGRWLTYAGTAGERWMGFDCVRGLEGVDDGLLMVPLVGHTHGHAGIAIDSDHGWRLLAGDAYFHHAEMDPEHPRCTPGLRFYQWMMEKDRTSRLANQERLRELCRTRSGEVDVFCSHDVREFERRAGHAAGVPVTGRARDRTTEYDDEWDDDRSPGRVPDPRADGGHGRPIHRDGQRPRDLH